MKPFKLTQPASAHLDLVRGLAALAVMLGHVRSLFFVEYSQVEHRNLFLQGIYFLTGFGHESVMIFFVLSGLFIGPNVLESVLQGRWSWKRYSAHRLTRLYIVLIPALLLTGALDRAGQSLPGAQLGYRTPLPNYRAWTAVERTSLPIFLGNVLFLESIVCPPFGSNAPLWSLSYEFWYYLLFPLLVLACAGGPSPPRDARPAPIRRFIWILLALLVAWFIGYDVLTSFPIWLMGAVVALLHAYRRGSPRWAAARLAASGATLAATLALVRAGQISGQFADYAIALAAAWFIHSLLPAKGSWIARAPANLYVRAAHWLAGFSYTLYLTHLPILLFLRAMVIRESRWQPTPFRLMQVAGIALLALACCYAISLATEAHTTQVRQALLRSPTRAR